MNVSFLHNQGSAGISEDGIVYQPPHLFGVLDGTSGVYLPQEGPRLFDGESGGQFVSHTISSSLGFSSTEELLEDILRRANSVVGQLSKENGLHLHESEFLPATTFVVAKVTQESVNIIQGGDSLAVWEKKDGTVGGTPNRAFSYEKELLEIITGLMEKHQQDRREMWKEFRPILMKKRRAGINTVKGGFAVLNGQPEFENFWQKFTLRKEELASLILFTDGFVPFEWTLANKPLAGNVMSFFRAGGLNAVLENTYNISEMIKDSSHEDRPEATAIAIKF